MGIDKRPGPWYIYREDKNQGKMMTFRNMSLRSSFNTYYANQIKDICYTLLLMCLIDAVYYIGLGPGRGCQYPPGLAGRGCLEEGPSRGDH